MISVDTSLLLEAYVPTRCQMYHRTKSSVDYFSGKFYVMCKLSRLKFLGVFGNSFDGHMAY